MPITSSRNVARALFTAVMSMTAACGSSPSQPITNSDISLVNLIVTAPPDLAPGEVVQLTALAYLSDGSIQDVTTRANWSVVSTPSGSVLMVTRNGLATAGERGRSDVHASFGGLLAGATIFVLPRGTFQLVGVTTRCNRGVPGATVTLRSGIAAGLTARSDASGYFGFYGVLGPTQIHASLDGNDVIRDVNVTGHTSMNLPLDDQNTADDCF